MGFVVFLIALKFFLFNHYFRSMRNHGIEVQGEIIDPQIGHWYLNYSLTIIIMAVIFVNE